MYHIHVIQPKGYAHTRAFDELVDLLRFSMMELGYACSAGSAGLVSDRINIIIGCHLIPENEQEQFPSSSIVLNTEPLLMELLHPWQTLSWSRRIIEYAKAFEVWDYSEKNVAGLTALGARKVRLLRIGYQPELARVPKVSEPDIDVLFYGSYNDRRMVVLDDLRARGLNVSTLFGVYGSERDAMIARAKVVLNMHYYDQHIFEVVRVFYLMTNGKAVVSEVGPSTVVEPRFLGGVMAASYEALAPACEFLVRDAAARRSLEVRAFETIRTHPQVDFMAPLLAAAPAIRGH